HHFLATVVLLVVTLAGPVHAQNAQPALLGDVGIDQRLNEQVPLDLRFRDETGQSVRLGEYFGSKPVILTLNYYQCPMLCSLILEGLVSSLRVLSFDIGDQFTVVTVSFDPDETPTLAAATKAKYLQRYARPGAREGWHFLTGQEAAIAGLAEAVGFRYAYDAPQDQYAHASGIVVLTPQGKIARYFYGIEYAPRDLRLGLVEAAANKIGSLADQILLFCYHYDPATGKYSTAVLNTVRVGGVATMLALGTFLVVMWRKEKQVQGSKFKMKN
ncbi:MAG: SCO family protein, partial [Candidatus Binatia bacterium]